MSKTKKVLPIMAAFIVGVTGAAGYAVHAQTPTPVAGTQVQTSAQDPNKLDGETADDGGAGVDAQVGYQDVGGSGAEVADTPESSVGSEQNSTEAESGPQDSGPDVNESDTTQ